MKLIVVLCVIAFSCVECKKIVPIDKNANLAFINMEAGGGARPNAGKPPSPTNVKPLVPVAPVTKAPTPATQPVIPPKPAVQPITPPKSAPTQPQQIQPKPVNPSPVANPITTPGPGSVKQLITFYDSQGKASPIRPYSYSQAVKQG